MTPCVSVAEFVGEVPGPTESELAAANWELLGTSMIGLGLVCMLLVALGFSIRLKLPGSIETLCGLVVVFVYLWFRYTFAQDADLLFGPWADATARIAFGIGALLAALGYARMYRHFRTTTPAR
jgi:hypothetical protein